MEGVADAHPTTTNHPTIYTSIMRRTLLSSAILAVTSFASPAQQAATATATNPPHTSTITGMVLCSDTHRAARGAIVTLSPIPSATAPEPAAPLATVRVAIDGSYLADHLPAGDYLVVATMPGYLPSTTLAEAREIKSQATRASANTFAPSGPLRSITVRPNETAHFNLTLQRGAAIGGHILYSDGSPAWQVMIDVQDVSKKSVTLALEGEAVGVEQIARSFYTQQNYATDDRGYFRISGLPPGTYRLAAIPPTSDPSGGLGDLAPLAPMLGMTTNPFVLTIYSGDTFHRKEAKTYKLSANDEITNADIIIPADAVHHIRGHLTATDGRPIMRAEVSLTSTIDDGLIFRSSLDGDGAFFFPAVPSGTYTLKATNARIGTIPPNVWPEEAPRFALVKVTNAFADGTSTILVRDSNLDNLTLALPEIPVPAVEKN